MMTDMQVENFCSESFLLAHVEKAQKRFPKLFKENSLSETVKPLCANVPKDFIRKRSISHLMHLLVKQWFLQRSVEKKFLQEHYIDASKKVFCVGSTMCLLAIEPYFPREPIIDRDLLIKKILASMPGMQAVGGSFWRWLHPEFPYVCFYIEMQRLRGQKFTIQELHQLKRLSLTQELYSSSRELFLPFNEEEAFKHIVLLQKELQRSSDLPELMIQFRRQVKENLEFLVTFVRAVHEKNVDATAALSRFAYPIVMHINHKLDGPSPHEAWCFSCFVPIDQFQDGYTIDLIQAREHIMLSLRWSIGDFRDYNGGWLMSQNIHLKQIWEKVVCTIPESAIFVSKLLHSLQPLEARVTLSIQQIEKLVHGVATLVSHPNKECRMLEEDPVLVVKHRDASALKHYLELAVKEKWIHSVFELSPFFYFCTITQKKLSIDLPCESTTLKTISKSSKKRAKELHLALLDGVPPSFNPYLSGGDNRCRLLSKLLFEGLVRLDPSGKLQPAAAEKIDISEDGLSYTFHLRSTLWSNGYPVTAFDFANSWKNILSKKWFSNKPEMLFVIKNGKKCYAGRCAEEELGIHVTDARTLHLKLEYPDAYFLEKLTQPMFFPLLGTSQEPHFFNGPYLIKQNNQQCIELEINPQFWDIANLSFYRIRIFCHLGIDDIYALFNQGEIDWIGDPLSLLPIKILQELKAQKRLCRRDAMRPFFLYLNTQHPLLSSPQIRKALSLSINRTFICRNLLYDRIPLYHLIPAISNNKNAVSVQESQIQAYDLFMEGLHALSYTYSSLPSLTLTLPQLPDQNLLGEHLKNTWKTNLGLSVEVDYQPWNTFRGNLEKKEFHIWGGFDALLSSDKIEFLQRFEDKSQATNFSSWECMQYKDSLTALFNAKNLQQREQPINHMTSILTSQVPYIPICLGPLLFSRSARLKAEVIDLSGCLDFRFAFFEE